MAVASAANDADARILPDVYHLFRGGSGFDALSMLSGPTIEIFHFNDYVAHIPQEKQTDNDRVYPGDGIAPWSKIMQILKEMGSPKVLSLELFNKDYWKQRNLPNRYNYKYYVWLVCKQQSYGSSSRGFVYYWYINLDSQNDQSKISRYILGSNH